MIDAVTGNAENDKIFEKEEQKEGGEAINSE